MARLEGGTRGFAFASGMAAITAVARTLRTGDEILADSDLYGGTCRLFTRILERSGISARYADAGDLDSFATKITPRTVLSMWSRRLIHCCALSTCARSPHWLTPTTRCCSGQLADVSISATAARAWRRHRAALGHQVSLRPRRRDRRRGRCARSEARRGHLLPPEREGNALAPFDCSCCCAA